MRSDRKTPTRRTPGPVYVVILLAGLALVLIGFLWFGPSDADTPPRPTAPTTTAPVHPNRSVAPLGRSEPVRVDIPRFGLSAPVVPLGLEGDGTVQVPPIERDAPVGWYRGSPTPGQDGASVLLGHSTVGVYGKGAFFDVGRLRPGDRVDVARADGSTVHFTVGEVRQYPKSRFPADEVYGGSGGPQLRLVTCGGTRGADGYSDNIVAYADMTSSG
ncbi:class F sortase [Streptomyces sp. cg36]|uniref:class F sortase n=1 Tax=Streptomyces sp. cg36 TaxID=3238798 RepID=UPI0034E26706